MRNYHLYFACCTPEGGVLHYTLIGDTLRFAEKTPCPSPMYLNVTSKSLQVLLRNPFAGSNHSGLLEYPLDSAGRLENPGPLHSTQGSVACHLCRYKGETYVVNYLSGSVFCTSGALAVHSGKGVDPGRQEAPHTHFIAPAPDGSCLLSTDLGLDTIYCYDKDLQILSTAKVPAGHGARHLAYSEDGTAVFCVNELASTVTVFHYQKGVLEPTQTVSALPGPVPGNTAAAVRVRGECVYVSNRGADCISCLCWDGSRLFLEKTVPCGGKSPRDFLIVQDLLLCANEQSGSVSVFHITGTDLTDTGTRLEMDRPLCIATLSVCD